MTPDELPADMEAAVARLKRAVKDAVLDLARANLARADLTLDELPADMETPVRALAMRLERRALEYNDRLGHYAYIGDDCALDDRAAQALQALLKAYQEQRRALEELIDHADQCMARLDYHDACIMGDEPVQAARAALNQKGDER